MDIFIRVAEIWTPDETGEYLEFFNGTYDKADQFRDLSLAKKFKKGEGLPGQAWSKAKPVVMKSFDENNFLRTDAAHAIGLTSGIAIPIFAGVTLKAVIVFLCGHHDKENGAIEIWEEDGLNELSLIDGYYGKMERFEWLSRRIKFPKGRGLPGKAWELQHSIILGDLANSNSFLRAQAAAKNDITSSIAFPIQTDTGKSEDIDTIVTFLSSKSTPIAKRFEIWIPDQSQQAITFFSGIFNDSPQVEASDPERSIDSGIGVIGKVLESGIPAMSIDLDSSDLPELPSGHNDEFNSLLAIPIYSNTELNSIIALYN
jgi:hypothetical protein